MVFGEDQVETEIDYEALENDMNEMRYSSAKKQDQGRRGRSGSRQRGRSGAETQMAGGENGGGIVAVKELLG